MHIAGSVPREWPLTATRSASTNGSERSHASACSFCDTVSST